MSENQVFYSNKICQKRQWN